MNLLHIIASANPADGGPIEGIVRQDRACREAGVDGDRELVTLDLPDDPWVARFPIKVHALGSARPPAVTPWGKALAHWRYYPEVVPWLRESVQRYDAVIVNGLWNYSSFAASRVLPRSGVPYFVFTHGMLDPWFRQAYPLKHLAKQAFWLAGEGRLMAEATSVLFTCEEERRKARREFWGYGDYKETVVGYGASAPPPRTPALERAFRSVVPSLGERPYLLFLSRIHPKKGCDLLIEAFCRVGKAHPDTDLVMVGPDQIGWKSELEAISERQGMASRIHWTGALYGDEKWGALFGADAFVLPSHAENFGIAVAEALGCGTPVLITDKVDIWREIDAANAGIVTVDTLDATEDVLAQWLSMDDSAKAVMRTNAVGLFASKFDVAKTGPDLIDTMRSLL
ncbi:MAG: glycosyltransferase [Brevundimonas sp.]|jgi:glycosyltransferase involved in cell wall biosynthesis